MTFLTQYPGLIPSAFEPTLTQVYLPTYAPTHLRI